MTNPNLLIDLQDVVGESDVPSLEEIHKWLEAAIQAVSIDKHEIEVSILVTTPEQSRQLNHEFRGKDKPTNVLSFPSDVPDYLNIPLIGDLVVCHEIVKKESAEQGKKMKEHWAHMVIHGLLHLLGYDHESEDEAEIMESLEIEVLSKLGINNPYEPN